MAYQYPVYPAPQGGSGTYGAVPGPISTPDPYAALGDVYPNLGPTNAAASTALMSKLGGVVSPGTMNALKQASAQFGVQSGMPLSGLSTNQLFGNIAGFSEKLQQEGLQDYSSLIPTIASTQTVSPALLTDIASRNATMAAAPNPAAAQSYAQQLFQKYLAGMRSAPSGGGGGYSPAGGTGTRTATSQASPFGPNEGFLIGRAPAENYGADIYGLNDLSPEESAFMDYQPSIYDAGSTGAGQLSPGLTDQEWSDIGF